MSMTETHMMFGLASPGSLHSESLIRLPHSQKSSMSQKPEADDGDTRIPMASNATTAKASNKLHKRLVFTDPVAFNYLADDPSASVLAHRTHLEGYECYIVEQWACSRSHPTFLITTYTGDPAHKVLVSVLGVPEDEKAWSRQLKTYDRALRQYHARERSTALGTLMVTNLSSFPSSLSVIHVPHGDLYKNRDLFVVSENLKRLGCSGRAGLKMVEPTNVVRAKFHQLYKTSDKIPLNASVIELVKLCQVALFLFGNLRAEYVDGLLCDMTEQAINDWWIEFGTEYYNIEPSDGILGPTTVSGLLGMLMGARNRLHAYGAPVSKDVFDLEATKRGIAHFEKSQRIEKTRRLNHRTLDRLRRLTAKAASGEGWAMPRAVKSTVAELSGKGGEMVMEMVGAREKAGIAEIETVDIENFADLVYGERSKWLWHGKPMKSTETSRKFPGEESKISQKDDQGDYRWTKTEADDPNIPKRDTELSDRTLSRVQTGTEEEKEHWKRAALKRATTRVTDTRSGFGRIKDAVGRRGHHARPSKDEHGQKLDEDVSGHALSENRPSLDGSSGSRLIRQLSSNAVDPSFTKTFSETPPREESLGPRLVPLSARPHRDNQPVLDAALARGRDSEQQSRTAGSSVAGSIYQGIDLTRTLNGEQGPQSGIGINLRRTQSVTQNHVEDYGVRHDGWWPRHMSFSLAEESILTWKPLVSGSDDPSFSDPKAAMSEEILKATEARRTRLQLRFLADDIGRWVESKIADVRKLDEQAFNDQRSLEESYYPQLDEYHALRQDTQDVLAQERVRLKDATTDVEQLGDQLEYDLDQLKSKLEDVEDSVGEFERQVRDVESRVIELEELTKEKEGWVHWAVRCLTGIGVDPLLQNQAAD